MRIIMLIDMDYFFAQVEERDNPSIKGRPVVVGADPKYGKGRGVVATCNYEARKFGVRSALPISIAWKKCPDAVFLPPVFEKYSKASQQVMSVFREFADSFEQMSIDEAYLDVSKRCNSFEDAVRLGNEIKQKVLKVCSLTCSVGIGPNKLVAKIAAGENKPDGLTCITPDKISSFLGSKRVSALYGVGPKTEASLNESGYFLIEDVARANPDVLVEQFGAFGRDLFDMANGRDERDVSEDYTTKSIGRQFTFEKDTKSQRYVIAMIDDMVREIYRELRSNDFLFKTVTIKVRFEDFETHTKSRTVEDYSDSVRVLRQTAVESLIPFLSDKRKVRLVGVSVHSFVERKVFNRGRLLFV